MTLQLTNGTKRALEPTSIDKVSTEGRFDPSMPSARPVDWGYCIWGTNGPLEATPMMRALGYTRHPSNCHHTKKRLHLGSTQWMCADCGSDV
jgi:hypothetical protein